MQGKLILTKRSSVPAQEMRIFKLGGAFLVKSFGLFKLFFIKQSSLNIATF